jgi:hypothetical protein
VSMYGMFDQAIAFNQNISSWNVNLVTNYDSFRNGSALTIQNTPPAFR